jgi:hypothetical protein
MVEDGILIDASKKPGRAMPVAQMEGNQELTRAIRVALLPVLLYESLNWHKPDEEFITGKER